jgi:hypothetical protein
LGNTFRKKRLPAASYRARSDCDPTIDRIVCQLCDVP